MRIRIRFEKTGVMQYVGHLDIMRYFQKAMRRAKIPIAYSNGFNPHQIMSFAMPLGVGITSSGEYMDIELTNGISSAMAIESLNQTMVDGMHIMSFKELPQNAQKAMSAVTAARYEISYTDTDVLNKDMENARKDFFEKQKEIIITKKTKKGEKTFDIKPFIYEFSVSDNKYNLLLSAGSVENIKPELVICNMHKFLDEKEPSFKIHRLDMYTGEEPFVSLGDIGNDII